jgi:acyl-CoA thioesterase FadM
MKTTLTTFFDIKCTVHFEFIPQGQTLNQAYYVEILKRLREDVHTKGFNFDLTIEFSTRQFLAHKSITEMEHPFYSPDLALNILWPFSK